MDTLYCFKLCEDTGEIKRFVIKDYKVEKHKWNSNKNAYCFDMNMGTSGDYHYKVRTDKLDEMHNYKVYTFIDDIDYAAHIMRDTLRDERDSLHAKYAKMSGLVATINGFLKARGNV